LDLDAIFRAEIALHRPVHNHFTGDDIGGDLRGCGDGQLPLVERGQALDRAVDQQILTAGDLALHMQARSEPRARAVRCCTQWTHRICRHCGFFLPRRRSRLRRLNYWIHCNWPRLRLRRSLRLLLRRIRLLISPHSKLPQGLVPRHLYIGWGTANFRPCVRARQTGAYKRGPDGYLDRGTGLRFSFGTARLVNFRVTIGILDLLHAVGLSGTGWKARKSFWKRMA